MTCRGRGILQLQVVQVGLHMGNINLAAPFAHDLRPGYHLRWLYHLLVLLLLLLLMHGVLLSICGGFSLGFGGSLHDLTDFVGSVRRFYPLELLVSRCGVRDEAKVGDRLWRLAIDHFDGLGVHHCLLLVLVLEAGAGWVAGFLRAHAQVV